MVEGSNREVDVRVGTEAEADRERLLREVKRLVLAESDMKQVAVAAEHLRTFEREMNDLVVRVAPSVRRRFGRAPALPCCSRAL